MVIIKTEQILRYKGLFVVGLLSMMDKIITAAVVGHSSPIYSAVTL